MWSVHKTKGFIIGATLLALVLISGNIGLACGTEPAQAPTSLPPLSNESEIPANFTTYTDDLKLFSISYPSDWETALYYIPDLEKDTKEIINSLKTGLPIERPGAIFIAGGKECISCLSVNIVVEPILEQIPKGVSALDQMFEAAIVGTKIERLQDYREFSRVKTTIDGREAAIVDCEGMVPGTGKRHYLMMITLVGKTAWLVTCCSTAEDFATFENDFNTILRSLRISD